jgi:exopolysaccharide biosynthesis operon protein EpsL
MNRQKHNKTIKTPLALCVFALPLLAACNRSDDPLRLIARYAVTRDSNPLRVSKDADTQTDLGTSNTGDTIHRAEAGAELDLRLSQQHINAKASASQNKFNRFTTLDYTGHDVQAKWDGRAAQRWSGDAGYGNSRSLDSFSELHRPQRNLLTEQKVFANAAYQVHPSWSIRGGVARHDLKHSDATQSVFDRTEDYADLNLIHLNKANNSTGVQVRTTSGRLPERELTPGTLVNNNYRQNELNAVVDWNYSGKTRLQGRVGYVKRNYRELPARDFAGAAGRVSVAWTPAAKSELSLSLWREVDAVEDFISTYAVSKGVSLAPTWNATAKISVQGFYSYQYRDHVGNAGLTANDSDQRKDKLKSAGISVVYRPTQKTELGLAYQNENRDSNRALADYRDHSVMGSARIEF